MGRFNQHLVLVLTSVWPVKLCHSLHTVSFGGALFLCVDGGTRITENKTPPKVFWLTVLVCWLVLQLLPYPL